MRLRRLTAGEQALARRVFGAALDPARPLLVMHAPTGPWAMVLFGLMLFPVHVEDFAAEPLGRQAWFVHELAHVRQFQRRPLRTLSSWARVALSGGYRTGRAYRYALPLDWNRLNLEQEARAIEHAFLFGRGVRPADAPEGARMEDYESLLPLWEKEGPVAQRWEGEGSRDAKRRFGGGG